MNESKRETALIWAKHAAPSFVVAAEHSEPILALSSQTANSNRGRFFG